MLREKAGFNYHVEFTAYFWWFKLFNNNYSLHNVKVSGESVSADVKAAKEFLETLDKLMWRKTSCQSKYSIWVKPLCSGNRSLERLSSIRSPSNARFQRF